MASLILTLPLTSGPTAPEYDYLTTPDGVQTGSQGRAAAALLPSQAKQTTERVALIPARAVSWHRVALPDKVLRGMVSGRMDAPRVRSVLAGILEERLLDDADALHFAVFAAPADRPDDATNAWVAVCDRAWLQASLQDLEAAGFTVTRIVAESTPLATGTSRLTLSEDLVPAQLEICDEQGVLLLPMQEATIQLAQRHAPENVLAEPSVMALAEKHFGTQAALQPRAQRVLQAARSPWNLMQLEFTASAGGRLAKQLTSLCNHVAHAPQWRPARWGLLALVLVQVVGLNTLAWHQRKQLEDKRTAIQAVLKQTFPDVQLVVNAPLQMQRAVEDLARSRGVGVTTDLGHVIALVTPLLPVGTTLTGIEFNATQLRLKGDGFQTGTASRVSTALESQGLRARVQDGTLLIEPGETR